MTCEHLRPLLDEVQSLHLLFRLGENLSRFHVLSIAVQMVRCGRMTALTKSDGGVRGIVSGDVLRRLVARTMAQQLGPGVKSATSPHQYAFSTRAGCECIAHVLQGLCDLNPLTTVTSIDGVSAYDLISRRAMLSGLSRVDGGSASLSFVRMFYGSPSEYLWEDKSGVTHSIPQGEGGEQGDAMMPLLFCLGQHEALQVAHRGLRAGEFLFAFLDDIYMATTPDRVGPVSAMVQAALRQEAGISIHVGKTKIWNQVGVRPGACDVLERAAGERDPRCPRLEGCGSASGRARHQDIGHPDRPPRIRSQILDRFDRRTPDPAEPDTPRR